MYIIIFGVSALQWCCLCPFIPHYISKSSLQPWIWEQFIQTRVLKFRGTLEGTNWLFFPGVQNPPDNPTRGSDLKDHDIKEFLLKGPQFLKLYQRRLKNYKSNESHCLVELSNDNLDIKLKDIFSFKKYNCFEKLIRMTSFLLRFIDNMKLKVENKNLIVSVQCVKSFQIRSFSGLNTWK